MQIDENRFLESTIKFDDFLNHSCQPNCSINWEKLNLVALRNIKKDEELTYNYNTSEYDLINLIKNCSFKCNCNTKDCIGEIKGFKHLDLKEKKKIKKFLSPFLKKKFEEKQKNKTIILQVLLLFF